MSGIDIEGAQGMRCDAQYGSNPDLCYLQFNHRGSHSNRWGTTWADTERAGGAG